MTRRAIGTLLLVLACLASASAHAAQMPQLRARGQLYRRGPYGAYPAVNVAVTLNHPGYGRSSPSWTDLNGMYYFYNVPAGVFVLEAWVTPQQPMTLRSISIPAAGYVDVPPIQVP